MAEKKKEQKGKKEKPLDRWTIKELRDEALKVPNIQGIHGMNKEEIIDFLRKEKGIPAPEKKASTSVRNIKVKLSELRKGRDERRSEGASRTQLNILRRKISRLKKKTRP